jgi:hypothetical protein
MVLILTLKPKIVINQAVIVVPILAPIITLIDSVSVNNPAFEKLTTINVVAEEDCITDVIKNPVRTPKTRLDVMEANIDRSLFPASFKSASLITFMPKRNKPKAPNN